MALQNFQYDIIMREYNRRQSENRRILDERISETYNKIPRLSEIDSEVAALSAQKVRELLSGNQDTISDLKFMIQKLSAERISLLKANGYPNNYLDPLYTCPICQDTGYIDSKKCVCFKKAEIELLYNQSNLTEILKKENFDHFSFDYYSDTMRSSITGRSALETAQKAYKAAKDFVQNFDSSFENLFLYGETGVGKTFLSHCIANELLKTAHCVMYFSALDLFDFLSENTFSKKENTTEEDIIFDCDLLIIDDLGTELTNSFVTSQLFLCINERILKRKSTIISTNLNIKQISDTYSERSFSRIVSNYQLINMIGEDIRIQKKFSGGN